MEMAGEQVFESLDELPEWTTLRELLAAIEEQLGAQVRQQIEESLDVDVDESVALINVRELLSDIDDELGSSFFRSVVPSQPTTHDQ